MAEGIGALLVRVGADVSDLIDGFNKADKAVDKFTRQIDKRLLDPLAKVAGAAATAGAAIFAMTKNASDTVDQLGKMAQKIGMSVEALSGLKYAAELSDVSLQDLGQGLKQLSKYMQENNLAGISVEEQMLRIADEFEATADGVGKTAASMKYFGKAIGPELIPLLNQGRVGIEELRKEAAKLGIVFSTEAARKAEEFNDSLTRLKANATGVQIEMAGPFVKAFNDAAKAFLDAKRNGDGLSSTLSEIMLKLTMGSDAQIAQREMAAAGDALVEAWKKADAARRSFGASPEDDFGKAVVEEANAAVKAAEERIKMLRERNKILAPEDEASKSGQGKKKPEFEMPGDAGLGAALQEGIDEEKKVLAEAAQIADDARAKERERAKMALALDLQDTDDWSSMNIEILYQNHKERMKILMDAADAEQELAIQMGATIIEADNQSHSMKLEALRQSILTEEQLLNEQHEKKLEQLDQFTDDELKALGGRQAIVERLTREHEERLSRIRTEHSSLNMNSAKTFFGNMAVLMNTHSRKAFEIGKAAAIAETVINTHRAAMAAYASLAGIPIVGPFLGAAAAAAAIVAGVAQVQAIRAQSFGGGGGASGTFQASPTTGQPSGTPGGDVGAGAGGGGRSSNTAVIHMHGERFGRSEVRELLDRINEELRDGGRIVLADG